MEWMENDRSLPACESSVGGLQKQVEDIGADLSEQIPRMASFLIFIINHNAIKINSFLSNHKTLYFIQSLSTAIINYNHQLKVQLQLQLSLSCSCSNSNVIVINCNWS